MARPSLPMPSTAQKLVQMPQGIPDPLYYQVIKSLIDALIESDAEIADLTARSTLIVKAGAPAVGDVPDGQFRVIKNTTGPTYSLVVNDGGTLKSVALT